MEMIMLQVYDRVWLPVASWARHHGHQTLWANQGSSLLWWGTSVGTHPHAEVYLLSFKILRFATKCCLCWTCWRSTGIQGDGSCLSSWGHLEGTWPPLFLQGQQGVFSIQEEEGAEESRLCQKIEGDILTLTYPLTKFVFRCQGIPRGAFWMTTQRTGRRRRIEIKRVLGSPRAKVKSVWVWKIIEGKKRSNVLCSWHFEAFLYVICGPVDLLRIGWCMLWK